MDFFLKLFDTSDFPARWTCGRWSEGHGWLHVLSDLGIWSAYFAIPVVFCYFLFRRRDMPFRLIFCLFAAFILLCGTTHLIEAIIFWSPVYRFAGVVKLLTAVVSWTTVFALIRVIPLALTMRSVATLEREVATRVAELTMANQRLKASEGRFRTLFDSGVIGIAFPDKYGGFHDGNSAFLNMIGYTREELERGEINWLELTPEKYLPLDQKGVAEAAERGACTPYEKEYIRKDGTLVPILIGYALIDDTNDRYIAFVLDLTARREAEKASEKAAAVLQTLLAHVPEGIVMSDESGIITTASQFAASIMGELVGLHAEANARKMKLRNGECKQLPVDQVPLVRSLRGEVINNAQICIHTDDGREVHTSVNAGPILDADGKIVGAVAAWRDVTKEREANQKLEKQARLLDLGNSMAREGQTIIHWSQGMEALYGYTKAEAVGRNKHALLKTEYPQPPEEIHAELEVQGWWEGELIHTKKDGDKVTVMSRWVIERHGQDAPIVLEVASDITQRKQVQVELERASRQKDEFLAMLSHELRNPLAPIKNAATVMGQMKLTDPSLVWVRDLISRQVNQMTSMVDDLLDVSRVARGKVTLAKEVVPLCDLATRAVEIARPLIESKGHRLGLNLPTRPIHVEVDPARIVQVITNLLNNAAKYTPDRGQIWLEVDDKGGEAIVRVQDNGTGIAHDMLPQIWDLFAQADRTLDRSQGGLGIGLSLVKNLVELHGGRVAAYSEGIGRGSDFVVRLPLVKYDAPPPPLPAAVISQQETFRVVVCDDNRDAADSLAMLLQMMGNDVKVCFDGRDVEGIIKDWCPDIVLLDIGLPGKSGYEICRELRARPDCNTIPIIAMTGYGSDDDRRKTAEAGFTEHFVKPVDLGVLQAFLAEYRKPK